MAKRLQYFNWYPRLALSDTRYCSLTDEELGFYHRCLNHAWNNNGLPADPAELARVMNVSGPYLERVWLKVGAFFTENDGRLFNNRQEAIRKLAWESIEKAEAAKRANTQSKANVPVARASQKTRAKKVI
jgi:uncharacterized protein YdaU (DUF1376 family)